MRLKSSACLIVVFIIALLAGCKKPPVESYKGDTGNSGADAVTEHEYVTIKKSDWVADTIAKVWRTEIYTEKINSNVVTNGTVFVYMEENGVWKTLPLPKEAFFFFGYRSGILELLYGDTHGDMPEKSPEERKFKYVVLQGDII